MADNVAITAGTGTTVTADDISGVYHQRIKLSLGSDGTAVDAVAGAGSVNTGVQRVTLASDDPAVASLSVIDDWDESDRAKVNLISGQAGITGGAGSVGASTPRVTLASDDPLVAVSSRTIVTSSTSYTRPANTTAYTAGYAFSNSTSAPSVLTSLS